MMFLLMRFLLILLIIHKKSEAEEMSTDKSSEVNSNLQDDDKFMADVHTFPDFFGY